MRIQRLTRERAVRTNLSRTDSRYREFHRMLRALRWDARLNLRPLPVKQLPAPILGTRRYRRRVFPTDLAWLPAPDVEVCAGSSCRKFTPIGVRVIEDALVSNSAGCSGVEAAESGFCRFENHGGPERSSRSRRQTRCWCSACCVI